ncbi:hypothetical protein F2Q70_00021261 [Brassica cretica]|uniref:Uncharacterized protein n=1 Tax=Brassica cretica TaxID=69181 RepID=A0A8S9HH05_BRACR|nr:hypothetical protein F2Q70_00021261 [Brassica cretica]KAF2555492.1 hypothetical protein F2Q68_00014721 [Brassica cretica]
MCAGSFSGLVSSLLQPLLSFSQCSVFLVDGGCPARSGECTSSLWESYVADLTDLVLLQRNHYGLFMCAGLYWLGIATCFMVVSIKAFIGRVMCCPSRRFQRSLMKINKSLSCSIVKP